MAVVLEEGERIEDLQCKGLKIIQNKNFYTFTSDSVILANFINLKKNDSCVEIGTGCGVIPVLLSVKTNFDKIYAFELQNEMARLAEKNILLNKLEDKVSIICDDVRNFNQYFPRESFDVVFSNPPYMSSEGANKNLVRSNARHDKSLPIDDLCKTAFNLLKFGGKFYVVYSAARSCELIHTLIENNLEPKRMFFTENGKRKVILVIIEAVKGGKHGVEVLPNLITNDKSGEYIKTLQTKYFAKSSFLE